MSWRLLISRRAVKGWLPVILSIWGFLGHLDTAFGAPNMLNTIWGFVASPVGYLTLFVLGMAWLYVISAKPSWFIIQRQEKPTIEQLQSKLSKIEEGLMLIKEKVEPERTFNAEDILKKVRIGYSGFSPDFGNITRSVVFVFDVHNASSVWIQPKGRVQ